MRRSASFNVFAGPRRSIADSAAGECGIQAIQGQRRGRGELEREDLAKAEKLGVLKDHRLPGLIEHRRELQRPRQFAIDRAHSPREVRAGCGIARGTLRRHDLMLRMVTDRRDSVWMKRALRYRGR